MNSCLELCCTWSHYMGFLYFATPIKVNRAVVSITFTLIKITQTTKNVRFLQAFFCLVPSKLCFGINESVMSWQESLISWDLVNRALYWVLRENISQWHRCVRTDRAQMSLGRRTSSSDIFPSVVCVYFFGPLQFTWGEMFLSCQFKMTSETSKRVFYICVSEREAFCLGRGPAGGGGGWKQN